MNAPESPQRPKLHPLVATAAISVIALSAVGIGAFVMNRSGATTSPYDAPAPVAQSAPTGSMEPARAAAIAPASQPATPTYAAAPPSPVTGAPPQRAPAYDEPPTRVAQAPAVCHNCGVVDSINDVKVKGEGTGVGGVGGAVVGGLLGNQIGGGRGNTLATVAGAVGGAFAGNAIEKNVRGHVVHRMVVRLDDGTTRTFTQSSPFGYGVGERVRLVNGHVERG